MTKRKKRKIKSKNINFIFDERMIRSKLSDKAIKVEEYNGCYFSYLYFDHNHFYKQGNEHHYMMLREYPSYSTRDDFVETVDDHGRDVRIYKNVFKQRNGLVSDKE